MWLTSSLFCMLAFRGGTITYPIYTAILIPLCFGDPNMVAFIQPEDSSPVSPWNPRSGRRYVAVLMVSTLEAPIRQGLCSQIDSSVFGNQFFLNGDMFRIHSFYWKYL